MTSFVRRPQFEDALAESYQTWGVQLPDRSYTKVAVEPTPPPPVERHPDLQHVPIDLRFPFTEVYVLHLFSGLRRDWDIQHHLEALINSSALPRVVHVLSIDVALDRVCAQSHKYIQTQCRFRTKITAF